MLVCNEGEVWPMQHAAPPPHALTCTWEVEAPNPDLVVAHHLRYEAIGRPTLCLDHHQANMRTRYTRSRKRTRTVEHARRRNRSGGGGPDLNPVAVIRYLLAKSSMMFVRYQQNTRPAVANEWLPLASAARGDAGSAGCAWWCGGAMVVHAGCCGDGTVRHCASCLRLPEAVVELQWALGEPAPALLGGWSAWEVCAYLTWLATGNCPPTAVPSRQRCLLSGQAPEAVQTSRHYSWTHTRFMTR